MSSPIGQHCQVVGQSSQGVLSGETFYRAYKSPSDCNDDSKRLSKKVKQRLRLKAVLNGVLSGFNAQDSTPFQRDQDRLALEIVGQKRMVWFG
jgi:hypothetical protein